MLLRHAAMGERLGDSKVSFPDSSLSSKFARIPQLGLLIAGTQL